MTIYKSFENSFMDEYIKNLNFPLNKNTWEQIKPTLRIIASIKNSEDIKGIAIDEKGITFYITTK